MAFDACETGVAAGGVVCGAVAFAAGWGAPAAVATVFFGASRRFGVDGSAGGGALCAAGAALGAPCVVLLVFAALESAPATFVCETGPLSPGLFSRTTTTMFPAPSCVAVAVPPARWPVDADSDEPESPEPAPCDVVAEFEAPEVATVTFVCEIGPSSPGLLMRTITTTFVGCCCVAVADELAAWSVVAEASLPPVSATPPLSAETSPPVGEGTTLIGGGGSTGGEANAVAGTNPLQRTIKAVAAAARPTRWARHLPRESQR